MATAVTEYGAGISARAHQPIFRNQPRRNAGLKVVFPWNSSLLVSQLTWTA